MLYIYEYQLYDRMKRALCNLQDFKEEIVDVYEKHLFGIQVFVYEHSFYIISATPIKRGVARPMAKELCRNPDLKQYGKWIKTKNGKCFRLFSKRSGAELNQEILLNLYSIYEGGDQR